MTNVMNANANIDIRINNSKRAIEISKKVKESASIYGSPAYNAVRGAQLEHPGYRVVVKSAPKKKFEDRLSMRDILLYVEKHSGADSVQMKELLELRGTSVKEAGNKVDADEYAGFNTIKEWFFLTYPELAKKSDTRKNRINAILAEAAKRAEAAKNAASA